MTRTIPKNDSTVDNGDIPPWVDNWSVPKVSSLGFSAGPKDVSVLLQLTERIRKLEAKAIPPVPRLPLDIAPSVPDPLGFGQSGAFNESRKPKIPSPNISMSGVRLPDPVPAKANAAEAALVTSKTDMESVACPARYRKKKSRAPQLDFDAASINVPYAPLPHGLHRVFEDEPDDGIRNWPPPPALSSQHSRPMTVIPSGKENEGSKPVREVSSHEGLLPTVRDGESKPIDSMWKIQAQRRTVYVTYNNGTDHDFSHYLWLLQHGETDVWYTWPKATHLEAIAKADLGRNAGDLLPRITDANPGAWNCPRINATRALALAEDDSHVAKYHRYCADCGADRTLLANESRQLKYYSVVQSFHSTDDPFRVADTHRRGFPIYSLRVYGSRQAAAADAFYNAAVHGWSTLFTCATPEDENLAELWKHWDQDLDKAGRHADVIAELFPLVCDCEGIVVSVLY